MESSAPTASPSLKKLKREAAQRRKAQARSLKLRAEEQERLQRLEIDALVEQQRLERLERQRCEELAAARAVRRGSPTSGAGAIIHQQQHQVAEDGKCKTSPRSSQQKQDAYPSLRGVGGPRLACMSDSELHKSKGGVKNSTDAVGVSGWRGPKDSQRNKHAQQQSMRAAVESRRRLARGPRSGVVADTHPTLPSEDHRVVSTEYQAAGTQALMRVTLLAAGFVIGARGISARLIGQVTGAIVQSWTESCRPEAVPIRLFRIQGKKVVVQAAVGLIGQAVAKYKDLCDCKRRGEFVQREHLINGVEFYYQPPPRKAFVVAPEQPHRCSSKTIAGSNHSTDLPGHGSVVCPARRGASAQPASATNVVGTSPQISFTPHHVWLQHLHAQQQKQQLQEKSSLKSGSAVDNRSVSGRPGFFDWRIQQQQQVAVEKGNQQGQILQGPTGGGKQESQQQKDMDVADGGLDLRCTRTSELEQIDQGLQQSVASLEQALQQARLEQRMLHHNRVVTEIGTPGDNGKSGGGTIVGNNLKQQAGSERLLSLWGEEIHGGGGHEKAPRFQLGSSLFSIFGSGESPLPVTGTTHDNRLSGGVLDGSPGKVLGMPSMVSCSTGPFDFPRGDFLKESLQAFPFGRRQNNSSNNGSVSEYSLYGHTKTLAIDDAGISSSLCIVCLEQPAGVRLMACGHTSFCLTCVQGLVNCPLCREKIVGLHQCHNSRANSSTSPAAGSAVGQQQRGVPGAVNGSSYHLWNWVPGASV